jgi:intermediate peptidase
MIKSAITSVVHINCRTKVKNGASNVRNIVRNIHKLKPSPLFGLSEPLVNPSDFITLSIRAINRINWIRDSLTRSYQHLPYSKILIYLDSISNELCNVIDAAELCRNVHATSAFKESAEESFAKLSEFIVDLNSDVRLYNILSEILKDAKVENSEMHKDKKNTDYSISSKSSITSEEFQFGQDLLRDFRLEGIHLIHKQSTQDISKNEQDKMKEIQQEIQEYEMVYATNTRSNSATTSTIRVGPFGEISDLDEFHSLKKWVNNYFHQEVYSKRYKEENMSTLESRTSSKSDPNLYLLPNPRIMTPLMNSISNEDIRKSVYFELLLAPSVNTSPFINLLKSRQNLSTLLEWPSFGHKALAKHVLQQPDEIKDLLTHLSTKSKAQSQHELYELSLFKQDISGMKVNTDQSRGTSSKTSLWNSFTQRISQLASRNEPSMCALPSDHHELEAHLNFVKPWDIGYLQNLIHSYRASSMKGAPDSASSVQRVKAYLPVQSCIDSIAMISKDVFQIELVEEECEMSEVWNGSATLDELKANQGIRKFRVYQLSELTGKKEPIGLVFFDLFLRDHKFPGAAHFTVRCGCDAVDFDVIEKTIGVKSKMDGTVELPKSSNLADVPFDLRHQKPVVVLAFNFDARSNGRSGTRSYKTSDGLLHHTSSNQILLSLQDLETLYHEWGHALHSLLSRTKFQHLSGTRGGTDFIEVSELLYFY